MPRRPRVCWAGALLLAASAAAMASAQTHLDEELSRITLEEAVEQARAASPTIRLARAEPEFARADLTRARTYQYNPQVSITGADRSSRAESTVDHGIELAQEIEIGGQRFKRIGAAEALLEAAESDFRRAEQQLVNRVELAFARALAEERRVQIAESELALVEHLLSFEDRRLEAGAGTQLDLNLARAAAARGRQRFETALAQRTIARADLAEAMGADPNRSLVPISTGSEPRAELPPLEALIEHAAATRPDVIARQKTLGGARQRVELERREARPNLRASLFTRREEGDDILGGSIGIAIPLFNRNQAGIEQALAEAAREAASLALVELDVRRSVVGAHARYRAAAKAVAGLESLVVGTLEESLQLLETALDAGKVNAVDVLVLRRELVEAQRLFVDAQLGLAVAFSDLRLAVGGRIPSTTAGSASGDP